MVTQKKHRADLKHQYGRTELSHPHLFFKKATAHFSAFFFFMEIFGGTSMLQETVLAYAVPQGCKPDLNDHRSGLEALGNVYRTFDQIYTKTAVIPTPLLLYKAQ
jgi:hypothetical protein